MLSGAFKLTKRALILMVSAAVVWAMAPVAFAGTADEHVPTFSKDVAPIFQKPCQNCHHPGSIAPMSLMTYQDSRPWARSIKTKVSTRIMPPWHIDRNI